MQDTRRTVHRSIMRITIMTRWRTSNKRWRYLISQQGWTNNVVLDTTTTLYAGISAEKANKLDEAAVYYGKIAEKKATGEGFIEIYKWLADHYKQKGDVAASQ